MFKSLRNRLILSHVLPMLIIIPLAGLALIYFLETQVLLPELSTQLVGDARYIAEAMEIEPEVWNDPVAANTLLNNINPNPAARAMLITSSKIMLASTELEEVQQIGSTVSPYGLQSALEGQTTNVINYFPLQQAEIIDVFFPVRDRNNNVVGVVRMTYFFGGIYREFTQIRFLIGGVLVVSLIVGVLLGLILALTISRPIRNATHAVYNLAYGDSSTRLTEAGPEELRTLSQAVNFLTDRLQALEKSRRQLLSNLVHELGRPLGALRSAILALQKGAGQNPDTMMEYLNGLDNETARLQRLLEDLAHVQEQILGTLELQRQTVDLSEYLPIILRPWQAAATEKHIQWETNIPEELPLIIADADRLAQAIGNLTSNAIKFTPPNGKVTTTAGTENGQVWIRVSDSGPGISQEDQRHIFEPFFRGQQNGRVPDGMGLGLGIARELITAHAGRLTVESEVGKGSTFIIWLPINASLKQ